MSRETRCGGFSFIGAQDMIPGSNERIPSRTQAIAVLIIGAFVVLAYLPSFAVPFLFDDFPNIVFNPRAQPGGIADLWMALDARGERDRPVAMLSFALNYLHAGLDVRWYHAVNLAIHLVNTVLLYLLVLLLARAPLSPARLRDNAVPFALAVALIWALHPVNTQAVTYIVQRMTSLAATFYLAGLLLFVLWRSGRIGTRWAVAGFVAAFLAGFGTKANVMTLPLAVLLIDVALFSSFRRMHAVAFGVIAAAGIGVALVYAGPQLAYLLEAPPHRDFSGIERLLTQGRVICHYLTLLIWPDADRLQLDYDFSVSRGLVDPPVTLAAIGFLFALTLAAIVGFRRARWPAMGWLFFLLALSVESSVILLELAFEHRLYLPATLLIAGILAPLFSRPLPARGLQCVSMVVLALAAVLAWQTMARNQQWQDNGIFWSGDLERGASLYRSALNSGIGFLRAGNAERAQAMFERIEQGGAAGTPAQRAKVAQLIGESLFLRGRYEDALVSFRRALEERPQWIRSAYFAGMALVQLERPEDAAAVHDQMREQSPDHVFTHSLEAEILRTSESLEQGIGLLRSRLAENDDITVVDRSFLLLQMGNMYHQAGDAAAAAERYRAALEANPDNRAARAALREVEAGNENEHDR